MGRIWESVVATVTGGLILWSVTSKPSQPVPTAERMAFTLSPSPATPPIATPYDPALATPTICEAPAPAPAVQPIATPYSPLPYSPAL